MKHIPTSPTERLCRLYFNKGKNHMQVKYLTQTCIFTTGRELFIVKSKLNVQVQRQQTCFNVLVEVACSA